MSNNYDDNDDSPEKCRERRRRRMEMRRLGPTESSDCSSEGKRVRTEEVSSAKSALLPPGEENEPYSSQSDLVPAVGTMSVSGRSREMEDAISVRIDFCRLEIFGRRSLHFFAVFDGHGGPHVAALCKEKMHVLLEEELTRVCCTLDNASGSESIVTGEEAVVEGWQERWRGALSRCFARMDEMSLRTCSCGRLGSKCECHSLEVALAGSTAVVAVITPQHIVVANCGDSRAVLCRDRTTVPLSCDHKPDRPDELARIGALGGRVIFVNGARVEGILAMSRAIGDRYLKPYVISEPEISFTKRDPKDECLILASDGLWDVVSIDTACGVASECLRHGRTNASASTSTNADGNVREEDRGEALYPSRSALAAALLTRLALGRNSLDNISVIVIDLKRI